MPHEILAPKRTVPRPGSTSATNQSQENWWCKAQFLKAPPMKRHIRQLTAQVPIPRDHRGHQMFCDETTHGLHTTYGPHVRHLAIHLIHGRRGPRSRHGQNGARRLMLTVGHRNVTKHVHMAHQSRRNLQMGSLMKLFKSGSRGDQANTRSHTQTTYGTGTACKMAHAAKTCDKAHQTNTCNAVDQHGTS